MSTDRAGGSDPESGAAAVCRVRRIHCADICWWFVWHNLRNVIAPTFCWAGAGEFMTLADLIAPGSGRVRLHFPAESVSVDYGELWKSGEAVGRLRATCDGRPVAIVLSNTRACATVLVGAIAAGLSLVSVPMPPRGANLAWYSQFI